MTTSIMRNTVSPDLIITTPAQLVVAFENWAAGEGEESNLELATDRAQYLIELLKQLNGG